MGAAAAVTASLTSPVWGEPAPWFRAHALSGNPSYAFDTAAGRPILLLFFGSAAQPVCAQALQLVLANRALFDDANGCFFGVTIDLADDAQGRIAQQPPGADDRAGFSVPRYPHGALHRCLLR